jgi:AcrR family transcriptional regulator
VGVREIAEQAGVDPAMIFSHFKSKKHLFIAALDQACRRSNWFDGSRDDAGPRIATRLLQCIHGERPEPGMGILLRSTHHFEVSAILRSAVVRHVIEPMADSLEGAGRGERAFLIWGLMLGTASLAEVATVRSARDEHARLLGVSLQFMIDGAPPPLGPAVSSMRRNGPPP